MSNPSHIFKANIFATQTRSFCFGTVGQLFLDAIIFSSIVPSRLSILKSATQWWPGIMFLRLHTRITCRISPACAEFAGVLALETIVNKSASNCGQGLSPETTYQRIHCLISPAHTELTGGLYPRDYCWQVSI